MAPANPWLERRVLAYAHQGGAREAPSSTLHAIRRALAAGADAIELDVHATRDGVLVVCHDATVDRTTNGSGRIAAMTLAEVRALDNAYWFVPGEVVAPGRPETDYVHRGRAPEDPAFGIATLDEVLDEFRDVAINLDIKETAPEVAGYEQALAESIGSAGREHDVIVASFHDVATQRFAGYAPDVGLSLGTQGTADFYRAVRAASPWSPPPGRFVALQVPRTFGSTVIVDGAFVHRAHEEGLAVHVWTIDDEAEMRALLDLGVDGIITDRPSVLTRVLAAHAS